MCMLDVVQFIRLKRHQMQDYKYFWNRFQLIMWMRQEIRKYSNFDDFSLVINIPSDTIRAWLNSSDSSISKDDVRKIADYREMDFTMAMEWLHMSPKGWEAPSDEWGALLKEAGDFPEVTKTSDRPQQGTEEVMVYRGRRYKRRSH